MYEKKLHWYAINYYKKVVIVKGFRIEDSNLSW
jgi:hypothetical protein